MVQASIDTGGVERVVMYQHDERPGLSRLTREPGRLRRTDAPDAVGHGNTGRMELQRPPRERDRVEHHDAQPARCGLGERRFCTNERRAAREPFVEASPAPCKQRRRVPETKGEPPEIGAAAGMPATRREVMIAVQDREPGGREQLA